MPGTAIVYHYWNESPDPVWKDWQNPILLSIASLRSHNPTIPIYVLDISQNQKSWSFYPRRLNFKHVQTRRHIPILDTPPQVITCNYNVCSRMFDLEWLSEQIQEDIIVSVESDFIWMRDTITYPYLDRFHTNGGNSGYFAFDKRDPNGKEFRTLWKHYLLVGMCNAEVRNEVLSQYPFPYFMDETVLNYLFKTRPHLCGPIPGHNHIFWPNPTLKDAITVHFVGTFVPRNRALLFLIVREFWEVTRRALTGHQLTQIFGPDYLANAGIYGAMEVHDINLGEFQFRPRPPRKALPSPKKLF